MTAYFFDTSALLKRYIIEAGRDWIIQALDPASRNFIFIAQVTPVEIISGISRLKRENIISDADAREARLLIRRHVHREYRLVNFTNRIVERAQDLLEAHPPRAYDAVQLASALDNNARLVAANQPPLTFVCADQRLLAAATSEGLQAHNPV